MHPLKYYSLFLVVGLALSLCFSAPSGIEGRSFPPAAESTPPATRTAVPTPPTLQPARPPTHTLPIQSEGAVSQISPNNTPTPKPSAPVSNPTPTPSATPEARFGFIPEKLTQFQTPLLIGFICGLGLLALFGIGIILRLGIRTFQPGMPPANGKNTPSAPLKMVLCPHCQKENREEAYFCQHCGQALPSAPASTGSSHPNTIPLPENIGHMVRPAAADETLRLLNRPSPAELSRLDVGQASDMGRHRPHNEDSYLIMGLTGIFSPPLSPAGLFVIADGMGGHQAGEVASRAAVLAIAQQISDRKEMQQAKDSPANAGEWLTRVIQGANRAVYEQRRLAGNNMGTTLVAALWLGERLLIANVGDSRAYLLNDQGIHQLTNDHSMVELWVAAGKITREEAAYHSQRNVIYRMVGDRLQAEVDLFEYPIAPNEAVLLCSDGLNGMLPNEQIWEIWHTAGTSQEACDQLINAANEAGGDDNITTIIARRTSEH